jgi:hypothetical protein
MMLLLVLTFRFGIRRHHPMNMQYAGRMLQRMSADGPISSSVQRIIDAITHHDVPSYILRAASIIY